METSRDLCWKRSPVDDSIRCCFCTSQQPQRHQEAEKEHLISGGASAHMHLSQTSAFLASELLHNCNSFNSHQELLLSWTLAGGCWGLTLIDLPGLFNKNTSKCAFSTHNCIIIAWRNSLGELRRVHLEDALRVFPSYTMMNQGRRVGDCVAEKDWPSPCVIINLKKKEILLLVVYLI